MLSVLYLILFYAPLLTNAALKFNSHEMFLLAVFGIVICGNLTSGGKYIKGWISGFIGMPEHMGRALRLMSSFARFTLATWISQAASRYCR